MKEFLKMLGASFTAMVVYGIICIIILIGAISGFASLFSLEEMLPVMPSKAVLTIDMSKITLTEQTQEVPILDMLQSAEAPQPLGVLDAVAAINAATFDPAVKYIFLKPDGVTGGPAQMEEIRNALQNFRDHGKAVVSYIENPTNGGYYLASVSDKIYMTSYDGGMNMFCGLSSQLIFLKDALDRLGINVQLIRHGKYKSAGETFVRNSSSKENMQQNEEMVGAMWDSWSSAIAESRGLKKDDIDRMLDEMELVFPKDFLEKGLVDELLTQDQLEDKLAMLFMTDSYKDVQSISIQDYAMLNTAGNPSGKDKIAVIYAEGEIVDGEAMEEVAGDRFVKIIQTVRNDKDVKAVVLRVNSPGGSVLASEKIKAQIDSLSKKVPVIASYGDYAASGGYWISAGCDYIYANESTLTGSIGVFSMVPDLKNTINDKFHVNITSVNSNKHADMYNMMRPLDKQETAMMQASVEQIYDRFTQIVAEGRDMTVSDVDEIAQGRVWTGAQALEIGLVDAIGTIEDAIIHAALLVDEKNCLDNIQIVEYPRPVTNLEMITAMLTGEEYLEIAEPLKSIYTAFSSWDNSQSGKVYARIPYAIEIN
jgi:protease-4